MKLSFKDICWIVLALAMGVVITIALGALLGWGFAQLPQ